jgi:hypothetical protein
MHMQYAHLSVAAWYRLPYGSPRRHTNPGTIPSFFTDCVGQQHRLCVAVPNSCYAAIDYVLSSPKKQPSQTWIVISLDLSSAGSGDHFFD